jgi:hypothetical protein
MCECGAEKCSGCIQPELALPTPVEWVKVVECHHDPKAKDKMRTEEWGGVLSCVQGLLPEQLEQPTLASVYILIRRSE